MLKIIDDVNNVTIESRGGVYVALHDEDTMAMGANITGCTLEEVVNICINLQESIDKITGTHPAIKAGFSCYMLDRLKEALEGQVAEEEDVKPHDAYECHEGIES